MSLPGSGAPGPKLPAQPVTDVADMDWDDSPAVAPHGTGSKSGKSCSSSSSSSSGTSPSSSPTPPTAAAPLTKAEADSYWRLVGDVRAGDLSGFAEEVGRDPLRHGGSLWPALVRAELVPPAGDRAEMRPEHLYGGAGGPFLETYVSLVSVDRGLGAEDDDGDQRSPGVMGQVRAAGSSLLPPPTLHDAVTIASDRGLGALMGDGVPPPEFEAGDVLGPAVGRAWEELLWEAGNSSPFPDDAPPEIEPEVARTAVEVVAARLQRVLATAAFLRSDVVGKRIIEPADRLGPADVLDAALVAGVDTTYGETRGVCACVGVDDV